MNSDLNDKHGQNHMAPEKFYEKPTVVTFGSVANLTHGVGGTRFDNGHNDNTKKGGQ